MADNQERIKKLTEQLDYLLKRQNDFFDAINTLKGELDSIKSANKITEEVEKTKVVVEIQQEKVAPEISVNKTEIPKVQHKDPTPQPSAVTTPKVKGDWEKFIGENLINKIGIAITVVGVAIGAKYSIEHDLISPLTRIILGYLTGIGLLAIGIKLKKKYENYSAVLVSGAIAIMYFITYAAYSFYGLFPQLFAFALMLVFTVFTVVAAINYNNVVIAQIGLVGAYAVPFLLSEGSGKVGILFSYIAIINIGILIISFKKYWKSLYYSSFGLTWLIFFSWYILEYQTSQHFSLALIFLSFFFVTFYLTFLSYKLFQKEKFEFQDVVLLLLNSFVFYGLGYSILSNHETGVQLLGLFTLLNAIIHFILSSIIYRQKLADKNLFYFVVGLVLVFITIAVPVQLDGNWVTLFWAGEAALLFWLGRTKSVPIYEKLSYPLMVLAFFSIIQDWGVSYYNYAPWLPESKIATLFNIHFLSSLLFIAAFAFIYNLNRNTKYQPAFDSNKGLFKSISYRISFILVVTIYYAFRLEIENYWSQRFSASTLTDLTDGRGIRNYDLLKFETIWVLNYTMLFLSLLALINLRKIKNKLLGIINLVLIAITVFIFLLNGLYVLSELRDSYLNQAIDSYYKIGSFNLGIRYVAYTFVALSIVICYKYLRADFMKSNFKIAFDLAMHTTILWVISSELIHWLVIYESGQSYKLGLSILWGIYSLFIIGLGIYFKKKHLRIGSLVLFGVTLIKLFFYDISHLGTISKTIVFVSLGVLLLIISFLYNKYKNLITDETTH